MSCTQLVCACARNMVASRKQKTAYEIRLSLVGSEMCIRDRCTALHMHRKYPDDQTHTNVDTMVPHGK